jgi:hypothetical protein
MRKETDMERNNNNLLEVADVVREETDREERLRILNALEMRLHKANTSDEGLLLFLGDICALFDPPSGL